MIIFEYIIIILSVIGLVRAGIFIGREFGSLEKFAVWFIRYKLMGETILPPYEDLEIPAERLEMASLE